jgi:hypothetical protein
MSDEQTKPEEVPQSPETQVSPTGELTTAKLDEVVGGFSQILHDVFTAPVVAGGLTGVCKNDPPGSEPAHITNGA